MYLSLSRRKNPPQQMCCSIGENALRWQYSLLSGSLQEHRGKWNTSLSFGRSPAQSNNDTCWTQTWHKHWQNVHTQVIFKILFAKLSWLFLPTKKTLFYMYSPEGPCLLAPSKKCIKVRLLEETNH